MCEQRLFLFKQFVFCFFKEKEITYSWLYFSLHPGSVLEFGCRCKHTRSWNSRTSWLEQCSKDQWWTGEVCSYSVLIFMVTLHFYCLQTRSWDNYNRTKTMFLTHVLMKQNSAFVAFKYHRERLFSTVCWSFKNTVFYDVLAWKTAFCIFM